MKEQEANTPLMLRGHRAPGPVNLATADHVQHNRPGMRPDTLRHLKEAAERKAIQPHLAAADLARDRARLFVFVMPSGPNLFMQEIDASLGEMSGWLSARRLTVEPVISQNPGHEARAAGRVLLALARGEPILSEMDQIRSDIVMRGNLP